MKTAQKPLCAELFKLKPEWNDTYFIYSYSRVGEQISLHIRDTDLEISDYQEAYPAYNLDYLLEKLPPNFHTGDARGSFEFFLKVTTLRKWFAGYNKPELGKWLYDGNHGVYEHPYEAGTPADAAIQLLINLVKEGKV